MIKSSIIKHAKSNWWLDIYIIKKKYDKLLQNTGEQYAKHYTESTYNSVRMHLYDKFLPLETKLPYFCPREWVNLGDVLEDKDSYMTDSQLKLNSTMILHIDSISCKRIHYCNRQVWAPAYISCDMFLRKRGRMPFLLPPMTHVGERGNWTQTCWTQVSHLNHQATPAPSTIFIITDILIWYGIWFTANIYTYTTFHKN